MSREGLIVTIINAKVTSQRLAQVRWKLMKNMIWKF
jgi:hypothetical protein